MKTVYDLAMERIKFIFDEFDHVQVSFSGGKDSGVMLSLCLKYLIDNHIKRKISLVHLDYEVENRATLAYIDEMERRYSEYLDVYRVCVPFKFRVCTSMFQTVWRPWDEAKRGQWVRELPAHAVTADDLDFSVEDMKISAFRGRFSRFLHDKVGAKKSAVLIGIRMQESLNRWRAINVERKSYYKGKKYTTKVAENVYNVYPIFDWLTDDVWVANAKFGFEYNRLYDDYYKLGVPVADMRVASPFISEGQQSLKMYQQTDPEMWAKMVDRVLGANFTSIYGDTELFGRKVRGRDVDWQAVGLGLLERMPDDTKSVYQAKIFELGKKGVLDNKNWQVVSIAMLRNNHTFKNLDFSDREIDDRKARAERYDNLL